MAHVQEPHGENHERHEQYGAAHGQGGNQSDPRQHGEKGADRMLEFLHLFWGRKVGRHSISPLAHRFRQYYRMVAYAR
ncbi:MAG TPA: hypothetical protein VGG13_01125 [Candidatus Saccharimonadales bacterium]